MPDQPPNEPTLEELAKKLRERFEDVLDEPVPLDILDLLAELERLSRDDDE